MTLAPRAYVRCVQRAGGIAIVLPPDEAAVAEPDLLLDRVDALMLWRAAPTSIPRATGPSRIR